MDSLILAQESTSSGSFLTFLIVIAMLGGFFYLLIIRPQRTQMRRRQELARSVEVGDRVRTGGGILGDVRSVDDDTVVISTEDGSLLRVMKMAVVSKIEAAE